MASLIASLQMGLRKKSINFSTTDLNMKKTLFFTPSSSNKVKGPKWCVKHKLVCLNTIPAPSFQNSMACEEYVIVQAQSNKYQNLFLDPLPEVPDYVPAPQPFKSLPVSKSMSELIEMKKEKTHYPSPLSKISYAPMNRITAEIAVDPGSDSSDEVDTRLYDNPPPPLKLHKNLPVQRVY